MKQENRGIVVLGAPRSGTTLLRRILNAHPSIACPGETAIFSACARFLQTETVADGLDFGVVSGLSFAGFEPNDVLARLRQFAIGFHEEYAAAQKKTRWAEKTAVDIFHLVNIEKLLGDNVQYVFVVRHGLDVACSIEEFSNRGHTYLTELHEYVKRHARPLEAFAHAWVDACAQMQDFMRRNPENFAMVRYEELIADPLQESQRLLSFLGESVNDDIIEKALQRPDAKGFGDWKTYGKSTIETSSIQRWKTLPPNLIGSLAEICNPTLVELGYEAVQSRPPETQAAAQRKYEFALAFGSKSKKID